MPFWWHSMDLGSGSVTPGRKGGRPGYMAEELEALHLPDLRGKTVLDVGAWDGFYSFEAEGRGAARVVALDHYVWSIDWSAARRHPAADATPRRPKAELPGVWKPEELPGKRGFDVAREALASDVETVVADFMEVDLDDLGTFDVVLYLGVLYHMKNPFEALRRVARVTREVAVIESEAAVFAGSGDRPLFEFLESDELNEDPGNWWVPNAAALASMCRAAGFERVEVVRGAPGDAPREPGGVLRYREIVHAWK